MLIKKLLLYAKSHMFFYFALCLTVIISAALSQFGFGAAYAAGRSAAPANNTVPGDVIVIFKNMLDEPVTAESIANGGAHDRYVRAAAEELSAKVTYIYNAISINNNEIMALLHSDIKNENDLWMDLRMRHDVKGASLNYVKRINFRRGDPK